VIITEIRRLFYKKYKTVGKEREPPCPGPSPGSRSLSPT